MMMKINGVNNMTTMTKNEITLSKTTLSVLKNFSTLNSNILVKPGNVLRTITPSKNGMAEATVEETFDVEFGIWDLSKFLGVVSLFSTPKFEFGEKSVVIHGGNGSRVTYFYSEPRLLTTPTKNVNMPSVSLSVDITEKIFAELQKASSVLQLPDLSFVNENDRIMAVVSDLQDPTTNNYKVDVGANKSNSEFSLNFKMENIKILPGDYTIEFSKNVVGQFTNETLDLKYWFAMETNSKFN
jgi:hypothetical protein